MLKGRIFSVPKPRNMRIELNHPYKAIATLTTEELPDLAILIGRNGAGKTQLLEALKQGVAVIPGICAHEIEMHDMLSFRPPNANSADRHANQFAKDTADSFFGVESDGQPLVETAASIFEHFARDIEQDPNSQARKDFKRSLRNEILQSADFAVFGVGSPSPSYSATLFEQVLVPLIPDSIKSQRRWMRNLQGSDFQGNNAALLSAAMKLTGKLAHELTRDDILNAAHYEGDTLTNTISEIFVAYKIDQFIWAHKQIENKYVEFAELITEYRTKNPPPWQTLREILSAMRDAAGEDGLFDFDFSDPEDRELNMANYETFQFKAELTNRSTGAEYDLDSLSSGEKVLMALCLAIFNQGLGRRSPKMLLLDELDSVLHPTMISALVNTLKTVFVPKGTKVLMTSHSAMTMAALDETDIFRVVRSGGDVKVVRTSKSDAINELSEGFATVDVGLKIAAYDAAKVTILTEGGNAKHIKRWVQLNFPEGVHVFEELGEHTNDGQLLNYGRLLGRMNTNTHFVVVWDCDAKRKSQTLRDELPCASKVTPFAFAKREDNSIATSGIENTYDEEFLEPYAITTTNPDGSVVARSFPNNRKTEFANHVLEHATAEYFTHLQDLHDIVSNILETPPPLTSVECEEELVGRSNGKRSELRAKEPFMGEVSTVLD